MSLLSERVKHLRQERNWTQAELAEKVHVHQKQISTYERGITTPSTDVLMKLAEIFNVTLDYLAFDVQGNAGKINIQDRELLRRFEAIDPLPDSYRAIAKEMLDLLVLKHRFQTLATTGPI
jgi:transcriptional regulator with XRE-family HTH domain